MLAVLIPQSSFTQDSLENGGFEEWEVEVTPFGTGEVPEDWDVFDVSSCCVSPTLSDGVKKSTNANSGSFAILLGGTDSTGFQTGARVRQDVDIEPGKVFTLSVFATGSHTTFGATRAVVEWLDEEGNVISPVGLSISIPTFVPSYQQFTGNTATAPCNAEEARISLHKADFGFMHFDDVSFQENPNIAGIECDDE